MADNYVYDKLLATSRRLHEVCHHVRDNIVQCYEGRELSEYAIRIALYRVRRIESAIGALMDIAHDMTKEHQSVTRGDDGELPFL